MEESSEIWNGKVNSEVYFDGISPEFPNYIGNCNTTPILNNLK